MPFKLTTGENIHLSNLIEKVALQKVSEKNQGWVIEAEELKSLLGTKADILLQLSNGDTFVLNKIIGYSYENWTPVVFILKDNEGNLVTNFLYMKGGTEVKNWNFVNSGIYGPNLWPDARKFILGEVIKNT